MADAFFEFLVDAAQFAGALQFKRCVSEPSQDKKKDHSVPELERPPDGTKDHVFSMQYP
jgi:hypothetical protein